MKINKFLNAPIFLLLLGLAFTSNNCTYKNAQEVFPIDTTGCYAPNVSFSKDIVPVLIASCYPCHSIKNASFGLGYVLEGYANDTLYIHNLNPNAEIYNNIADPNIDDFYHMPKGLPSISECEILKIKAWIDQGYKNN